MGEQSLELAKYIGHLTKICEAFRLVSFKHLPCLKNQLPDTFATLSSVIKISEKIDVTVVVETYERLIKYHNVETEPDGNPWDHDIRVFLTRWQLRRTNQFCK